MHNQSICKIIVFQHGKGIVRPVVQFHAWVFLENIKEYNNYLTLFSPSSFREL
jgi:hypothetical protein